MRSAWLFVPVLSLTSIGVCQQVHCPVQQQAASTAADAAYLSGDSASAERLFTAQLAVSPTLSSFSGLVRSQLEQNKLPEALASARKAAATLPKSGDAEALSGDALERGGEISEALAAYKSALALDVCSAAAHFGLARLSELNAGYATAAEQMAIAQRLAPADAEIRAAYAELLPAEQRLPLLRSLLASQPAVPPERLERLRTEEAILEQHKSCTIVEGDGNQRLELLPVLFNGKYARSWGLRTKLNDKTSPLLELDTSVSGIVLNTSDAQKAGVKPLDGVKVSANGSYVGSIESVRIGDAAYRDCPVRVVADAVLADSNSLIGADFFRGHLIHIDYVSLMLALKPLPGRPGVAPDGLSNRYIAPDEKDWSPVYVAGPAVLVPTLIDKKGPFLFLLDTGVYRSVISPAVADAQLHSHTDATLNLRGSDGPIVKVLRRDGGGDVNRAGVYGTHGETVPVSTPLSVPTYRFTNNVYPDTYSVSFDLSPTSHATGTEVSGLLGFGVLRGYYLDINYRDGLAQILFDQNRTYEMRAFDGFH